MFDTLKRKAKQALAKAVVSLPYDAGVTDRRTVELQRLVQEAPLAGDPTKGLLLALDQPDALYEITSDQASSTRNTATQHDSWVGRSETDEDGAAVVIVRNHDGKHMPALLLDQVTLQSMQISINAYQRERRWVARKADRDDERESLRQRVLTQVYALDEMLARSLRSGAKASVIEDVRDLQYELLKELDDLDNDRKAEVNRKADLEDDRLYQDAEVLRRVGEAFYAAGLVGLRSESDCSLGSILDTRLLEGLEAKGPTLLEQLAAREPLANVDDQLQQAQMTDQDQMTKEEKNAEYYKRRLNDLLDDWDHYPSDDDLWVLFRATIHKRSKIRRYTVLRDAILQTCEDLSGAQEAADARDLTQRIADSISVHQEAVDTYVARTCSGRIPWPLRNPAPSPYEDFEDIRHWLSEMADMEEELAHASQLSDFRKRDYETKYAACDEAQKKARLRLQQAGMDYDQMRRAEEEATVEELYRTADCAYDDQEDAQEVVNDEFAARQAEGKEIDLGNPGPYLKHLVKTVIERKVSFFEKRMTFEKYGDMDDFKSRPQEDDDTITGSSVQTPSASDYCDDYLRTPDATKSDDETSITGMPGHKVGKEPTFARWKYGLGPFDPDHEEASSRAWEGEPGLLSGTFSDCSSYDGDESDPVLVMRWRHMADKSRVAIEGLDDECLDGLSHLFRET